VAGITILLVLLGTGAPSPIAAADGKAVVPSVACGAGDGNFGAELMGTDWPGGFTGVPVYSNGPDSGYDKGCQNAAVGPSGQAVVTGTEWQCVELVNRLYVTKGWISATWHGDGDTMWLSPPKGLKTQPQHEITRLLPGDVVSIDVQPPPANGVQPPEEEGGHVLIVSDVQGSTITFVSQNAGDTPAGVVTYGTLNGGTLSIDPSGRWTYPVDGVVDAPATVPITGHPSGTVVVKVPASVRWLNTGIMLAAGDEVLITARGQWDWKPGAAVSPTGLGQVCDDGTPVAPDLSCFSLVGRIGSGIPFEIGGHVRIRVKIAKLATLYLSMNDGKFSDNSGSLSVRVSIVTPSSPSGGT
jgi:hypothetical protein